jgi:hypothetical protein
VPVTAAGVVVVVDVVVVLVVVVGVVVDVPQDVSNIAATINIVKPNQINFFFISSPFFNYSNRLFFMLIITFRDIPFYGVVEVVDGKISLILIIPLIWCC